MAKPDSPMRKYGVVEPTEAERVKSPLSEKISQAQKEKNAREDGLRKAK